ncbi:type II toxin-antitoxin system RelE/ParE family toxin [Streptomyces parvus]|uniref:type II toxin-antitoxin system RelE/ParE family toxin n=1 Tax=Streptomyces parvus TaxID=66428 RepID=UPI002101B06D|nr:type II toxin-antitoxin system RelE/ParE family toxin [Streptomyces parvus]MCQ1576574.1 type II toxin-antitoxin system RelE/ParE family toxin [Streptomyces parvus]
MNWEINLHSSVELWLLKPAEEDPVTAGLVEAAVDVLADSGPALGRPLVDRLQGCRIHNLKELRPAGSGRSEVRILFVFDPGRRAILLVAGDKAGRWSDWYREAIPVAERRYDEYRAAPGAPRDPGGVR